MWCQTWNDFLFNLFLSFSRPLSLIFPPLTDFCTVHKAAPTFSRRRFSFCQSVIFQFPDCSFIFLSLFHGSDGHQTTTDEMRWLSQCSAASWFTFSCSYFNFYSRLKLKTKQNNIHKCYFPYAPTGCPLLPFWTWYFRPSHHRHVIIIVPIASPASSLHPLLLCPFEFWLLWSTQIVTLLFLSLFTHCSDYKSTYTHMMIL